MSVRPAPLFLLMLIAAGMAGSCAYQAQPEDREYMTRFCTAIDEFSDALVRSDPATALDRLVADLDAMEAPSRLSDFHRDFLAYVRAVGAEPESIVGAGPPRPDADVRAAIAGIERDLPECWEASFFGGSG